MSQPAYSLEEVLQAVEKGITATGTARVLGVSRQTIINYSKRWKSVAEALHDKRREMVDYAETGLRAAVLRQEHWAVCYTLSTLGKDEGYTMRNEHTGKDGGPITSKVVVHWPEDEGD